MSNSKRTAEMANLFESESKLVKLTQADVKTELEDDYPIFPTLMELNPDYAIKVLQWELHLLENEVNQVLGLELGTMSLKQPPRQWFQFEFGKIEP